jgi:predicted nucleic acid-binding protein
LSAAVPGGGAPAGLGAGSVVLVDAAPFVYMVEGAEGSPRRAAVSRFLEAAGRGEVELVASAVAWTELLEGPLRSGDSGLAGRYRALLADSSRIRIELVDVAIAEEAAALRALRGLGLADSLHVATARVIRADAVLTNDQAWREVPECPRVLIVDELAFNARAGDGAADPRE